MPKNAQITVSREISGFGCEGLLFTGIFPARRGSPWRQQDFRWRPRDFCCRLDFRLRRPAVELSTPARDLLAAAFLAVSSSLEPKWWGRSSLSPSMGWLLIAPAASVGKDGRLAIWSLKAVMVVSRAHLPVMSKKQENENSIKYWIYYYYVYYYYCCYIYYY